MHINIKLFCPWFGIDSSPSGLDGLEMLVYDWVRMGWLGRFFGDTIHAPLFGDNSCISLFLVTIHSSLSLSRSPPPLAISPKCFKGLFSSAIVHLLLLLDWCEMLMAPGVCTWIIGL